MVVRIVYRRANKLLDHTVPASAVKTSVSKRNASTVAVPTSSDPHHVENDIPVYPMMIFWVKHA